MIRMSRLTDYAFLVLGHFVDHPETAAMSARDISAAVQLPLPTVSKLLKLLTRKGLLASHRGVNGGYSLSRKPDAISIAEVISALEGPIAMTDCNAGDGLCQQESHCSVRPHWHVINQAVQEALAKIALSRMAQITKPPGGALPLWRGR